ncbi:dTDP-4-dehydrorhamnose reductase [Aminipila sp.]|uniref:dTDP-4-dehydrorhamnose reductase n=1 Tax=Aminipila sp. TaxID=2060095 RepID=UPI00289E27B0|nr:dTDP-4-dehydrorhamnose reductase [Aminipila sp.]
MGNSVIGNLDHEVWNLLGIDVESRRKQLINERILVTGASGQLGFDICRELEKRKIEHVGTNSTDFNITNKEKTKDYIMKYNPTVIIHCSAYTAVDKAEDEPEKCFNTNKGGTCNVAEICKELGCKMIYISTDYVFSGTGEIPYEVNDETEPQNIYGKSKLAGEGIVKELLDKYFIVRISWVFGKNGNNFVKTMLRIGGEKDKINVVSDQIGSPTYTADLAPLLCDMAISEKYGTYHATNEGFCSWAELAEEIFEVAGYKTKVNPITTKEYPTKAIRPKNSRMSKLVLSKNGFEQLPTWKNAIKRYITELNQQNI